MEKGKFKKEKKYFSIMLLPHSSDKVRVFRFSSPHTKILSILAITLTAVICMGMFLHTTISENRRLKVQVSTLTESNIEQKNLIQEKVSELKTIKQNEINKSDIVKDFINKYKEITDNYISGRIDLTKVSRSGNRSERSFVYDLDELKGILENLQKVSQDDNSVIQELTETENKLKKYLEAIPTLWPATGRISSTFGSRDDPFRNKKSEHDGIDIAAGYGEKIKAAANGTVTFSDYRSGYGYTVVIDHGRGLTSLYGHASKLLSKEGKKVNKGDVIALVGSSGRSTGAHLHFEVRLNGSPVDPLKYLDKK